MSIIFGSSFKSICKVISFQPLLMFLQSSLELIIFLLFVKILFSSSLLLLENPSLVEVFHNCNRNESNKFKIFDNIKNKFKNRVL